MEGNASSTDDRDFSETFSTASEDHGPRKQTKTLLQAEELRRRFHELIESVDLELEECEMDLSRSDIVDTETNTMTAGNASDECIASQQTGSTEMSGDSKDCQVPQGVECRNIHSQIEDNAFDLQDSIADLQRNMEWALNSKDTDSAESQEDYDNAKRMENDNENGMKTDRKDIVNGLATLKMKKVNRLSFTTNSKGQMTADAANPQNLQNPQNQHNQYTENKSRYPTNSNHSTHSVQLQENQKRIHQMTRNHRHREAELMEQIHSLKTQLNECQVTLEKANARNQYKDETLMKSKQKLDEEINNLHDEVAEQEEHLEKYEMIQQKHLQEIESLKRMNQKLERKLESTQMTLQQITETNEELEGDLITKEREWHSTAQESKSVIRSLQKSNASALKEVESLKEEMTTLRQHGRGTESKLSEKSKKCALFQKQLSEFKQKEQDLNASQEGNVKKLTSLQEENGSLQRELKETKSKLEEIHKSKESVVKKSKHRKSSLEKLKSELNAQKIIISEFDEFRNVLEALRRTLKDQLHKKSGRVGLIGIERYSDNHHGAVKGETFNKTIILLKEIISHFNEQRQYITKMRESERDIMRKNEVFEESITSLVEQRGDIEAKYEEISREKEEYKVMMKQKYSILQQELMEMTKKVEDGQQEERKYKDFIEKLAGNFGKYNELMENKFRAMMMDEENRSSRESQDSQQIMVSREKEIKDKLEGEFMERIQSYEQEIEGLKGVMSDYDDMKVSYNTLSTEHGDLLMEYHDLRSSQSASERDVRDESRESSTEQVDSLKSMMGTLESKIASWKFTPARFYIDH